MYDNHSTDDSVDIAKWLGFEVRTFGKPDVLDDREYLKIKNNCWKEEREKADYVIVCDADEFLYHHEILNYLEYRCPFFPKTTGYNMISNQLPKNNIFEITTGTPDSQYSKSVIFEPNFVQEINFDFGCHRNFANVKETESELLLLHYRYIGGVERLIERHKQYAARMSNYNKKLQLGFQYLHSEEAKRKEFEYYETQSYNLKPLIYAKTNSL